MMSAESNSEKSVSYQKKDGRGLFSHDARQLIQAGLDRYLRSPELIDQIKFANDVI